MTTTTHQRVSPTWPETLRLWICHSISSLTQPIFMTLATKTQWNFVKHVLRFIYFLCMGAIACIFVPCACSGHGGQKGAPGSGWGFQRLWAVTLVLGTNPGSSAGAALLLTISQQKVLLMWGFQHLYHYPSKIHSFFFLQLRSCFSVISK